MHEEESLDATLIEAAADFKIEGDIEPDDELVARPSELEAEADSVEIAAEGSKRSEIPDAGELQEGFEVTFAVEGETPEAQAESREKAEKNNPEKLEGTRFTPRAILEAAAEHYGLSLKRAWSATHRREAVRARYSGYLLLREYFDIRGEDIAELVGKKPGAVYQGLRLAKDALTENAGFAESHRLLRQQFADDSVELITDEIEPIDFNKTENDAEREVRSPEDICRIIGQKFRLSLEVVWGIGRQPEMTKARHLTYLVLQDHFDLTQEKVGSIVGKSPGAVKIATLKARKAIDSDSQLATIHEQTVIDFSNVVLEKELTEIEVSSPDEITIEKILDSVAHYFGVEREQLSEYGTDYVRQVKRVAIDLLSRANAHPETIAELMGYKGSDTVYGLRKQESAQLTRFADEIWATIQEGRDFSETVVLPSQVQIQRRRRTSGQRSKKRATPAPETPVLPSADIDRLTLTAANYFGIEAVEVTNSNAKRIDSVLARTITFTILESECGMRRKDIAVHFGRATQSVAATIKGGAKRLAENRRAHSEILRAFKAGDTLKEQANEVKAERIREVLAKRKAAKEAERKTREVSEAERRLFEGIQQGNADARAKFTAVYGDLPRRVLSEHFGREATPEVLEAAEASLWKTARYFIPERHDNFERWAEKVILRDVAEGATIAASRELAKNTPPQDFFDVAVPYRQVNHRRAPMMITGEHAQEAGNARGAARAYLEGGPAALEGLTDKSRNKVERFFLREVALVAKVPYALRREKAHGDPKQAPEQLRELPRFCDFSEVQQREFLDLMLVWAIEHCPNQVK